MVKKLLYFALFLLLIPSFVYSGTTGKIAGKVIDKDTGDPLPGANVVIVGTTMGAATNLNGEYFIINVPVGVYKVKASMMGYKELEKTDVRVIQDLTTTVNFELEPTVLLGEVVTVVSERPMVKADATASTREVRGEEVMIMPKVDTFEEAISLQAGVVGTSNIRGGRWTEVAYMVDGMSVKDPLLGGIGAKINRNAIKEVMLLTGGFSAEYGQAMSGVVNVVTKEGGDRYSGQLRYTTDKPFGRELYSSDDNTYELSLGGPVPFIDKMRFYISGRVYTTDDRSPGEKVLDPAGNDLGKHPHNSEQDYSFQIKLTYKFNPRMKLTIGGFKARDQWEHYSWRWRYSTQREGYDPLGWSYTPSTSMLDHYDAELRKSEQWKIDWTHTLSPSTFYTANITYFKNYRNRAKIKLRERKERFLSIFENWWDDFEFVPIDNRDTDGDGVWDRHSYIQAGYSNTPRFPWGNPYGLSNVFIGGGDTRSGSRKYDCEYLAFKLDFVSQVTTHHQIKCGFEFFRHMMRKHYNSLPWDPMPFEDIYTYHPLTGAVYLLDKMEYKGMVVNAGLRLDYVDPEAKARKNDLDTSPTAEMIDAKTKWQISPRLGISHPVSDKTVLHFNYGWFFEVPRFNSLYDFVRMPARLLRRGNQLLGNPNLDAQKTKAWEFGFAHQITDNLSLDVTGFYKDMYDIEGVRFIPAVPHNYTVFTNSEYGKCYGVEFTLRKRYSNYTAATVNYTLSYARGTSSNQFQHYQLVTNGPPDPYTGEMRVYPQMDYWLGFDQRHTANVNFDFRIPEGEGPTLFGKKILENFGINILWRFHTGRPYTRQDERGNWIGEYNGARHPWYMRTDARINKDFKLFGMYCSLFAEIENLFNERRATRVHARTGSPDWNGVEYYPGQFTGGYIDERVAGRDLNGDGDMDDWNPQYDINADTGINEANPTPINPRGRYEPSQPQDLNGDGDTNDIVGYHDGIVTQLEYYNAYMRYIHDAYAQKNNYMRGRRIWVGFEIYF